jgi:hypothetical protein
MLVAFGLVVAVGAPFLPTKKEYVEKALDMLDLKSGDTLLDLGSGDGRMLAAAAKRGIYGIGYEVNFFLYVYSLVKTMRYRKYVRIICRSYWSVELPKADGIFVFLLKPYMKRLNNKLLSNYKKPPPLVSFVFKIPNKKPNESKDSLYLYKFS